MTDYKNLRALRGIASILIFYHHFGFDSEATVAFGDYAVSVFFMLSGLVLTLAYSHCAGARISTPVTRFLNKRALKIYPMYILALAAAIALGYRDKIALVLDVVMLQSWIPLSRFYFSGNAVSWFVSSLFFSYLMFIPCYNALNRCTRRFIGIFLCALVPYFLVVALVPDDFVTGIVYINPVMQLPTFILGMLIAKLYRRAPGRIDTPLRRHCNTVICIVIILVIGFIWGYRYIDERISLSSYWWPVNFVTLYVLLQAESIPNPLSKIMRMRLLQVTGDISFAFYLFHTIIISLYQRLLGVLDLDRPLFPSSLICLAVTLLLAMLIHYRIELPIARYLSPKSQNKSVR